MTSVSAFRVFSGTLALLGATSGAGAQARARGRASCDGKIVHEIRVSALRPPFKGEAAYWRRAARSIGLHHTTTDTAVVRRFLALETGGLCTDFRMRESARLLREQPFLADATVRAVPDDNGGVRIEVETVDEIPAIIAGSFSRGRISNLEIGNENMFGDAWLLALHGRDRVLEGRSAGFRASDFQFLGRPYQLDVEGDWGQRTSAWLVDASHGYLTDLQQIAWEAGIGHAGEKFSVLHRGDNIRDLAISYRHFSADIGGVLKLGNLRTPILLGAIATYVHRKPQGSFAVGTNDVRADTALANRYRTISRARLTSVAGWRNLNFVTARGFEALAATQDVPTGFQIFGQLGRGMPSLGGASDVYMLADMLAGAGSAKTYAGLHLVTEGRRENGQQRWDGVVSSGRLGLYWKPNDPNVVRSWVEYAGGWRVQAPFQLALSTESQRLIGYHGSLFGARRVAGGLEVRRVLPHVTSRGDVGIGAFVHATRLWAGDAPFGVDTPLLPSAGISVLGAVPHGSQRLLRIDVGAPLRSGIARSGWEVRLSFTDITRTVRLEPGDIAGAREQLVGPDVFRP